MTRESIYLTQLKQQSVDLPEVWCLCPTYGRFPDHTSLLDEALQSFLLQDYPNKHLLILNDCKGQLYHCPAPGVFVVNRNERYPTLGAKYNAMVDAALLCIGMDRPEDPQALCFCPWEDDDVSLPWRISLSVLRLLQQKTRFPDQWGYWNPRRFWYWTQHDQTLRYDHQMGVSHNASSFTWDLFSEAGGYNADLTGSQDADIDARLRALLPQQENVVGLNDGHPSDPMGPSLRVEEWYYIYRWGMHGVHLSSQHPEEQSFYDRFGAEQHRQGELALLPRFTHPWFDEVWDRMPKPPEPEAWLTYPLQAWRN